MNSNKLYIIDFFIGGFLLVFIQYIIDNFDTKMAAVLWTMPYTLIPILIMMWYQGHSNKDIASLGLNSSRCLLLIFIYLYTFYLTLNYFEHYSHGVFIGLIVATFFWAVGGAIYYFYF